MQFFESLVSLEACVLCGRPHEDPILEAHWALGLVDLDIFGYIIGYMGKCIYIYIYIKKRTVTSVISEAIEPV